MSIICLDTAEYKEADSLIAICKSGSGQHGVLLRDAHYKLGYLLAKRIVADLHDQPTTIVIMMRAGLCFGMGIADELEHAGISTSILFYENDAQWEQETANCPHALANTVLIVDAVINSGKSIIAFSRKCDQSRQILFAANVLSEKSVDNFANETVYTVRVSENSYIGSKTDTVQDGKGPDTGDRLFNTI